MAKTYILEPTEINNNFKNIPGIVDTITNIDVNTKLYLEVSDAIDNVFKYSGLNSGIYPLDSYDEYVLLAFVDDADFPPVASDDWEGNSIRIFTKAGRSYSKDDIKTVISGPDYYPITISIYYGEDDPDPEPAPTPKTGGISKNFSFVDHARNDLAGIADIVCGNTSPAPSPEPTPEPEPEPTPEPGTTK